MQKSDLARSYNSATMGANPANPKPEASGNYSQDEIDGPKLLSWFKDSFRGTEDFRRRTVESLKFLSNEQWDDKSLQNLPAGMAQIVVNIMLSPIMFISGVERQTRQEAKIVASEGGDPRIAEIMNSLVHWVENQNQSEEIDSRVFLDKIALGQGWWKWSMCYDGHELEGDIELLRRPSLAVYPDPNWWENGNWKDARFVFDTQWLSVDEACTRWPDFEDRFKQQTGEWLRNSYGGEGGVSVATSGEESGDFFSTERLFWDETTKQIRIAEAWYKETTMGEVAVNVSQPDKVFTDPQQLKQLKALLKQTPGLDQEWIVIKKPLTTVSVAWLWQDQVLDQQITPHSENMDMFPIFPATGYLFWKSPFGLADLMKDLQREKNKRRSKLIELVGRMPLSGFLVKESTVDQKELEEYSSGNGVIINYRDQPPEQIKPPPLPQALVELEQKATDEVRLTTNIHSEMLGDTTQKTVSGAAIEARQRGGFLSQESLFDTFRSEKEARVHFLIGMIKAEMSPTRAARILGTLAQQGQAGVNPGFGQPVDPGQAQELLQLLYQTFETDYDVVITTRPTEPSLAMQAWETLSDLKKSGADIPANTLWKAAQNAGLLTADQVQEIIQAAQPPPGQGPPGMPPGPPGGGGPPGMPGPPPGPPPPPQAGPPQQGPPPPPQQGPPPPPQGPPPPPQ